jgi:ABC-2 type transport system permease protein
MPAVLVVAFRELRQRLRDRSALVLGFLAPLILTGLINAAFHSSSNFHATVGYVDLDHGPVAASFASVLTGPDLKGVLTVHDYPTEASAQSAVKQGKAQAAVVMPAGFSAAVQGPGATPPVTVLSSADNALASQVVQGVASSFTGQVDADRLSVRTALATGAPPSALAGLTAKASALSLPLTTELRPLGGHQITAINYSAPGMGMFFVMFAIGFGSRGYFAERRDGTLERIAAAPVHRGTVVAGKAVATFGYALASLATTLGVSVLLFGASWGGFGPVALLCVAMAFVVVALTALVTATASTERQAEGASSLLVFGLALLGGDFVFIGAAPPALRHLALFTPNGWALRGFTDLATGLHGFGTIAVPVAVILAFAAAIGSAAGLLARARRLT